MLDDLKDTAVGMRTLPLSVIAGPLPRTVRDFGAGRGQGGRVRGHGRGHRTRPGDPGKPVRAARAPAAQRRDRMASNRRPNGNARASPPAAASSCAPHHAASLGRDRGHGRRKGRRAGGDCSSAPRGIARGRPRQAGLFDGNEVTDLAGRGVGLDAVRTHVHSLGGSLDDSQRARSGHGGHPVAPRGAGAAWNVLLFERGGCRLRRPAGGGGEGGRTVTATAHPRGQASPGGMTGDRCPSLTSLSSSARQRRRCANGRRARHLRSGGRRAVGDLRRAPR